MARNYIYVKIGDVESEPKNNIDGFSGFCNPGELTGVDSPGLYEKRCSVNGLIGICCVYRTKYAVNFELEVYNRK